jgi:hypothetical protein
VAVPLELTLSICVNERHIQTEVEKALYERFSNRVFSDGTKGVFHPDNFTFGQTVYLSPFYAAAQAVPGVNSVLATVFRRLNEPETNLAQIGEIQLHPLEIARVDNDPNYPERGRFHLIMQGGL